MTRIAIRAGAFALAFLAVYAAAILTPIGQQLDAASLGAFAWLPPGTEIAAGVLRDGIAAAAGVVLLATIASLLWTRRVADAARVSVAVGAVAVAGEVLKLYVLPRPHLGDNGYPENTFPSVHAAFVAVVLAVALRHVPSGRVRRGLGRTAFAVVFIAGLVGPLSYAHRGSDSVGGVLLAGFAVAALLPASSAAQSANPATLLVAWAVSCAAVALAVVAAMAKIDGALDLIIVLTLAAASAWVVLSAGATGRPELLGAAAKRLPRAQATGASARFRTGR